MNPSPLRNKMNWDYSAKSNFELSFSGENKLLIDEIQYQIDSLRSLSSNIGSKLQAISSLIYIFEKSIGTGLRKQLHCQINDLLQIISLLFTTHIENTLFTMNLLVLILLICSDMDGSIDPTIIIPEQLMTTILQYDRINHLNNYSCTCTASTSINTLNNIKQSESENNINNSVFQAILTRTSTMDTLNSDSGYRRKRKFTGLLSKSSSIQNTAAVIGDTTTMTNTRSLSYAGIASSSTDKEELGKCHLSSPIISKSHMCGSSSIGTSPGSSRSPGLISLPVASDTNPLQEQNTIYNDNRQSILFQTFWCSKCCNRIATTGVASDHVLQQQAKLLQLILINRFLNAKVQTLATIQTDFFQNTDYIDPNQHKHQSEDLHSSSNNKTNMESIQSPNDPTSRTSKSFYQRQTESLGQLQVSLQEHYTPTHIQHQQQTAASEDQESTAVVPTVLKRLCTQLHTDVNSLLKHTTTVADKKAGILLPSEAKALWGRLWLQLGILDSACFRCPYNQKYISKLSLENNSTTEKDESDRETVAALLVRLLQGLTPYLGSIMTSQQALTGRDRMQTTAATSAPYASPLKAGTSTTKVPPSPGTQHTTPTKSKPSMSAEWKKFHNLFSEIPIVLSHSVSEEQTLSSAKYDEDMHINRNTLGHTEKCHTEAGINIPELFTLALKTLVSLATDCNEVSCMLRNSTITNNKTKKKKEFLSWLITLLCWCSVWRYELTTTTATATTTNSSTKQQQKSGALSPNETVSERFIFDTVMYLQSLLNTLCSTSSVSSSNASTTVTATAWYTPSIAEIPVLDCLQHYPVLLRSLPLSSHTNTTTSNGTVTHSRAKHLQDKCPLILHLHSLSSQFSALNTTNNNSKIIRKNASMHVQNSTVGDLLVEMLYIETIDFVADLEETDDMIQNNSIDITKEKLLGIHEKSSAITTTGTGTPLSKRIGNTKVGAMMIPVAELIIAAHISLLLHALEQAYTSSGMKKTLTETHSLQDKATIAVVESKSVLHKLPHGNWWLCERVLKAFLSLQGQTGIMLLDNISTVLRTLAGIREHKKEEEEENNEPIIKNSLTIQDNHYNTITTTTASSTTVRNSCMQSNHDTFDELLGAGNKIDFSAEGEHPTTNSSSSSSSSSSDITKTAVPSGKWEWNGHDYVWVTTKSEQLQEQKGLGLWLEQDKQKEERETTFSEWRQIAMKKTDSHIERVVASTEPIPIDLFDEAPLSSTSATASRVVLSTPPCSQTPITSPKTCSQTQLTSPPRCSSTTTADTNGIVAADTSPAALLVSSIKSAELLPAESSSIYSRANGKIKVDSRMVTAAATTDCATTHSNLSYSCTQDKNKQRTSPSKHTRTAADFLPAAPGNSNRTLLRAVAPMRASSLLGSTTLPPPETDPWHSDTAEFPFSNHTTNTTNSSSRRGNSQSCTTATAATTTRIASKIPYQINKATTLPKHSIKNTIRTATVATDDTLQSNPSTEQKKKSGWRSKRKFASSV